MNWTILRQPRNKSPKSVKACGSKIAPLLILSRWLLTSDKPCKGTCPDASNIARASVVSLIDSMTIRRSVAGTSSSIKVRPRPLTANSLTSSLILSNSSVINVFSFNCYFLLNKKPWVHPRFNVLTFRICQGVKSL